MEQVSREESPRRDIYDEAAAARCAAPAALLSRDFRCRTRAAGAARFFLLPRCRLDDAGIITRKEEEEEEKAEEEKRRKDAGCFIDRPRRGRIREGDRTQIHLILLEEEISPAIFLWRANYGHFCKSQGTIKLQKALAFTRAFETEKSASLVSAQRSTTPSRILSPETTRQLSHLITTINRVMIGNTREARRISLQPRKTEFINLERHAHTHANARKHT